MVFDVTSSVYLKPLSRISALKLILNVLHSYECFTVKYATHRFHMKQHPGYE